MTQGEQERLSIGSRGEQERLSIGATGKETRKSALQQYMQQNFVMNKQREWSQDAYRMSGPKTSRPGSAQPGLVE